MPWLSRLLASKSTKQKESGEENLLVISDIHLGEDVLTEGPENLADYIRVLNRELAEFVRSHCTTMSGGRRWHLFINGDMFDFVKVSVLPDPEEAFAEWSLGKTEQPPDPTGTSPDSTVWKLTRILEIHRPLFKELARFLLSGHRITIIEGNHDAEFYYEEVRTTLTDFLLREADKLNRTDRKARPIDRDSVAARLRFRTWFDCSPGRFHIEHGHQYDQFCSFEYNLAPVDHSRGDAMATPMSHRLMPYFAELLGDFSTHGVESWTFGKWMRWVFAKGPRTIGVLFSTYFRAMWELLRQAGSKRQEELKSIEEIHEERFAAFAADSPYSVSTLRALARLRALPAEYSVWKMINVFKLDRLFALGGMALVVLLAVIIGGMVGVVLGGVAAVLGVGAFLAMMSGKGPPIEELLRRAAARIADATGARYVIFGHSHHPEMVNLKTAYGIGRFGETPFYINSGSWVTREILLGQAGRGMTYVEVSQDGAFLKRWLGPGAEAQVLQACDVAGRSIAPSVDLSPAATT
jgi:UDP-2,3-diacylglucosamine pyrophosphatase LpxH